MFKRATALLGLEITSNLVAKVEHDQLLRLARDQLKRLRECVTCTFERMTRSLATDSVATLTLM